MSLTRCGPWKPEQVVCLVCQLASALAYAHASHIVHLDLKPSNVLISENGTSRLTDFGVARFLAREAAAGSGTIVYGTPAYLAPERCHGDAAKVDGRADVYSLAVMNYELLLGRLPFEADPDDPRRTMQAHAQEPVPRPRDLNPDFPQAIERVLLLGLTKDPRARPRARSFGSQMERPRTGCGRGGRVRDWRATRPGRRSRRRSKAADNTADYRTVSMPRGGVRADQSEPALRTRLVADDRMMASAASPSSFLTRRLTELRLPVYRPHRSHGLWGAATALIAVGAFAIGAWLRPAPPPGLPPLAVIGISVEVDPRDGVGHCP